MYYIQYKENSDPGVTLEGTFEDPQKAADFFAAIIPVAVAFGISGDGKPRLLPALVQATAPAPELAKTAKVAPIAPTPAPGPGPGPVAVATPPAVAATADPLPPWGSKPPTRDESTSLAKQLVRDKKQGLLPDIIVRCGGKTRITEVPDDKHAQFAMELWNAVNAPKSNV